MKKYFSILLSVVLLASLTVFNGCKKDEDPVTPPVVDTTIPNDIFPLTAGRAFQYSGYLTTADTETKMPGTDAGYSSSWTIGTTIPFSAIGLPSALTAHLPRQTGVLIRDTTRVTGVLPAPKFTPIFVYIDTVTNDYYYLTNLGNFFRYNKVQTSATDTKIRIDSLRYIKLASPSAGLGGSFTAFEGTFRSYLNPAAPSDVNLKITGTWEKKEDLTLSGTTYNTYYLAIKRKATVGTATVSEGTTAKLWLVKGVGPVKMFLAGDNEVPGNYRELKSKNF